MAFTTHAEHFLTRIDRLNTEQAELALALYRDDELVRLMLGLANLPDRTERVAISLNESDNGPYVVVTRDGKFVTCLGEGMRPYEDQALIRYHKLEHLSAQVASLRGLFADAREGKRRRCDELILRVSEVGPRISQSEFDDLALLAPLVAPVYIVALMSAQQTVDDCYLRLRLAKRIGTAAAPLLRLYWKNVWAMAHLTLLVGQNSDCLQHLLELGDERAHTNRDFARGLFVLSPWQTGVMPFALRGTWLAAQLPKLFLKPLKHLFREARRADQIYAYGAALAAIGHRHQRYRAEVSKFLRSSAPAEACDFERAAHGFGAALARTFEEGEREAMVKLSELDATLTI